MVVGPAIIHARPGVTHLGNRGSDCPSLVTLPLYGIVHPSNITGNVFSYRPSPL